MPWRGPAGAQRPPHGGVYSGFGNERAKPLVFLLNQTIAPIRRSPRRAAGHRERRPRTERRRRVTCRQAEHATRLLREAQRPVEASARPALIRQEERREHLRVSAKTPRPQERAARDRARPYIFPLIIPAPDRHPNGPGLQARSAPAD